MCFLVSAGTLVPWIHSQGQAGTLWLLASHLTFTQCPSMPLGQLSPVQGHHSLIWGGDSSPCQGVSSEACADQSSRTRWLYGPVSPVCFPDSGLAWSPPCSAAWRYPPPSAGQRRAPALRGPARAVWRLQALPGGPWVSQPPCCHQFLLSWPGPRPGSTLPRVSSQAMSLFGSLPCDLALTA